MKPQINCYPRLNLLEHQLSDAPPTSRSITKACKEFPEALHADSLIGALHKIQVTGDQPRDQE